MNNFPIPDTTHITLHRVLLRQHSASGNSAARCRACLAEAMQNLASPSAMPPQSILIIRRLPDPSPGTLLTNQSTHTWSKGAAAQIASTWQRAIRAAQMPVPPHADAVWFADPAEWLACLSWDLHRGTAMQQWWWQSWLSHNEATQAAHLYRLWQQEAQSLPQAIAYLYAHQGTAISALLHRLSADQVQAITTLVEAAYALDAPPANAPALAAPPAATRLVTTLPATHAKFLTLCLGLVQTPLAVHRHYRRPAFAPLPAPPPSDPPPTPPPSHPASAQSAPTVRAVIPKSRRRGIPLPSAATKRHPTLRPVADEAASPSIQPPAPTVIPWSLRRGILLPSAPTKPHPAASQAHTTTSRTGGAQPPAKLIFKPPTRRKQEAIPQESTIPIPTSGVLESASATPARPIATNFGGVWLLINLLAQLGWLDGAPDVAPTGTPGKSEMGHLLNGWHKVAALAHALAPDLINDPLSPLLNTQTKEQVSPDAVVNWLAYARPLVHQFLAVRLEDAQEFFAALHDPAHMHITPTHIDVVFEIEQIRLPLRLAGLDQNPGWTPQLGRVVTLHYV